MMRLSVECVEEEDSFYSTVVIRGWNFFSSPVEEQKEVARGSRRRRRGVFFL